MPTIDDATMAAERAALLRDHATLAADVCAFADWITLHFGPAVIGSDDPDPAQHLATLARWAGSRVLEGMQRELVLLDKLHAISANHGADAVTARPSPAIPQAPAATGG